MSEVFKLLTNQSVAGPDQASLRRAVAVASALELILGKVSNSPDNAVVLKNELGQLKTYTQQIEDALSNK